MSLALKNKETWRPTANLAALRLRAQIISEIRCFFAERGVLEVETPLLCAATVTDPFIHSIAVNHAGKTRYLQTSPEYAMKRLLAAEVGSIYQICKAFRGDESGRLHNCEFTMLEWYRIGFDHHALMDEMDLLLQRILKKSAALRLTYENIFQHFFSINPHTVSLAQLEKIAVSEKLIVVADNLEKDDWLQLLMAHKIEPNIGQETPVFIYNFPASQAALAKIRHEKNIPVAERFEVYFQGVELANGYHELTNEQEQRQRFKRDLDKRTAHGYANVPVDQHLLDALKQGIPPCAGVALGIDRLVLLAAQAETLADVIAFPSDYA